MKNYILTILLTYFSLFTNSCNNSNEIKQKELELKERELVLKEKEIEQKERGVVSQPSLKNSPKAKAEIKRFKKELRYLFFANGGIRGYFDDGTIVGCPRCDFCKSNIEAMFNEKPIGTYIVEEDGTLVIDGSEKENPEYRNSDYDGWALIDYKWYIKPPQN